ncbi:MAG: porin [Sedimentisphaerales bacterium]|nr:porin [Sedimentisphaerales bacterium]
MRHTFLMCVLVVIFLPQGIRAQQLMSDIPDESVDDIFDMDIDELMEVDIRTGKPGWFGNQLEQLGFEPYIHGYAAIDYRDHDFDRGRSIDTFDMHYFNIIVGTNIGDKLCAEILLEYEHGGDDMGVRYGIIDYIIAKPVILRMGKFLVPMGRFNEYLSPEYANKLPDRPYCLWQIVPIVWAETGVQLRGEFELPSKQSVNYALYVVNGLEQPAGEGGSIRSMRQNNRDNNNSDKAWGGRIGFKPFEELEVGASYYTGAYTTDGKQDLSITDFHAEYNKNKLTIRGEYVLADQQTSGSDLDKNGFYAEAAYRINSFLEPVVRYDQADLDSGSGHDVERSTFGIVYYPNPRLHPMFNFKISQSIIHDDGTGDRKHEFVAQCVIGF